VSVRDATAHNAGSSGESLEDIRKPWMRNDGAMDVIVVMSSVVVW